MIDLREVIFSMLNFLIPFSWFSGAIYVFIDAKITRPKNIYLPPIIWFLLCLILSPIAVPSYFMIKKPKNLRIIMTIIITLIVTQVFLCNSANFLVMMRQGRLYIEKQESTAKLKLGTCSEKFLKSLGEPDDTAVRFSQKLQKIITLWLYREKNGTVIFVFESNTLIDRFYFDYEKRMNLDKFEY